MNAPARTVLLCCLATLSLFGGTGCARWLNETVTRGRTIDVHPGVSRESVLRQLGPPQQTRRYDPPAVGSAFPDAPALLRWGRKIAICDDYRISGLVVTGSNRNVDLWYDAYPVGLALTAGLGELIYLSTTAADLAARRMRHDHLRLYYDHAGHLFGESRSRVPLPPMPAGRPPRS